jgi:hypothetical protein
MAIESQGDDARGRVPGFLRVLRGALVVLLALSALLTLVGLPELGEEVADGRWPSAALALPPILLALFIAGYAVYRWALVRAGRYPAGKALVQVGLMVLLLGVVAGFAIDRVSTVRARRDPITRGLRASDPGVRAMAAELVRHRPPEAVLHLAPRLVELLGDRSLEVRREAHASLVALAGADLGDGPAAAPRWRARFPSP